MPWPTTSISTTNLDAGSDQPRLARSDLKDLVDAVNNIIADGGRDKVALYTYGDSVTTTNQSTLAVVAESPTELYDNNANITVSGSNIQVPAGTWIIEAPASVYMYDTGDPPYHIEKIGIYNATDSTYETLRQIMVIEQNVGASTAYRQLPEQRALVTYTGTKNLQLRAAAQVVVGGTNASQPYYGSNNQSTTVHNNGLGFYIKFTKLS